MLSSNFQKVNQFLIKYTFLIITFIILILATKFVLLLLEAIDNTEVTAEVYSEIYTNVPKNIYLKYLINDGKINRREYQNLSDDFEKFKTEELKSKLHLK